MIASTLRDVSCLFGVALLVILPCGGCDSSSEVSGLVKGKVNIDGRPAGNGMVSFVPEGEKYPSARGTIVDGQFELNLPVGAYKVMIRSERVIGETKVYATADSPMRQVTEEILPAKYNDQTELAIEVGPEGTECDFDLSSK